MRSPDPARALQLLDAWEDELELIFTEGSASHPVLIALRETIRAKIFRSTRSAICCAPSGRINRKAVCELGCGLDYCVYSANPVGRLVLYLCGYSDAARQKMSDATCTALQLANFWQDVSRDLEKGEFIFRWRRWRPTV